MPESTLTPAPVRTVTFPGSKNSAIFLTATDVGIEGDGAAADKIECGIVGTVIRILERKEGQVNVVSDDS